MHLRNQWMRIIMYIFVLYIIISIAFYQEL